VYVIFHSFFIYKFFNRIEGFESLEDKDKKIVSDTIGVKPEKTAVKRKISSLDVAKSGDKDDPEIKKAKTDSEMRLQSENFWKLKDSISKELNNAQMKELLVYNDQNIPKGMGPEDVCFFFCLIINKYILFRNFFNYAIFFANQKRF
jgi:hypothetical protein